MAWSGVQRAKRIWSMGSRGELKSHRSWGCWGKLEGSPDWRVSGRHCPEPCPASASWPCGSTMGVHACVCRLLAYHGMQGEQHSNALALCAD
jgi:hypothetical protein